MGLDAGVAIAAAAYVALIAVPGLAALRLLGLRSSDGAVTLALAAGLGLGLQPLIYLWASVVGVRMTAGVWVAVLVGAALVIAATSWHRPYRESLAADAAPRSMVPDRQPVAHLTLAGVMLFVAASRWWAVRLLSVPLWGDSLHHTMIVRLFALQGGLPIDWQPLAPLSSFTYHFGLHAGVATLASLTGLAEHRALLLVGQELQVLQVLTAYGLAAGLTRRSWAGVAAAVAAAGLGPMPAYYVNWGRYTQLAGQVVLPVAALAAAWASGLDPRGGRPWHVSGALPTTVALGAAAALLVAGLGLTHYLVAAVFGLFTVAWLAFGAPFDAAGLRERAAAGLRLVAVAAAALALCSPWLLRLRDSVLARAATEMISGGLQRPEVYGVVDPSSVWGSLDRIDFHVGLPLVAASLAAAVIGLWRRDRVTMVGVAWTGLVLLAAYPALLGLSMTPLLKDFTVAIGLYVPLGLVIGGAVAAAAAYRGPGSIAAGVRAAAADGVPGVAGDAAGAARAAPVGGELVLAGAVLALVATLSWKDRSPVAAQHVLVGAADERAMSWIRRSTPADAVFLVGCVEAFGDTVCAGDDAGWWIPLLGERRNTVPPVTYGIEQSSQAAFAERTNTLADLWRADLDGPETVAALEEAGVTHAFVGTTGSALGRERLASSPHWRRVYGEGGAEVYRFLDGAGEGP